MPSRHLRFPTRDDFIRGFDEIRAELEVVEDFGPGVEAELDALRMVTHHRATDVVHDRRDLPLVTIDPPSSMDLDQAFHAERLGGGFRVFYAIADPAAFIEPGGPLDTATRSRGVTYYAPDRATPLHPRTLSEAAASLLPGVDRPALLWTIDLDETGARVRSSFERAEVRSRAKLSYGAVQSMLDNGSTTQHPALELLREVGMLRLALEARRGGVSLNLPSQEVVAEGASYRLEHDESIPVESWNAQMSLLAGMTAGTVMLDAGIGILRTLPPPEAETLDEIRRHAAALDIDWPADVSYPQRVRELNPAIPTEMALLATAVRALRGAGYLALDGAPEHPTIHWAIGGDYAHVTAPLRRVGDRFANEVLLAIYADTPVPGWASDVLPDLPAILNGARRRERALERAIVDFSEALILGPHVGATFDAVVTSQRRDGDAIIQIKDPAISSAIDASAEPGTRVRVRLERADPRTRSVHFELVG